MTGSVVEESASADKVKLSELQEDNKRLKQTIEELKVHTHMYVHVCMYAYICTYIQYVSMMMCFSVHPDYRMRVKIRGTKLSRYSRFGSHLRRILSADIIAKRTH